jgi:aminomuconate-semialdehyde/2-hydroxymuconate-6-semialdehyde dehydrogenase
LAGSRLFVQEGIYKRVLEELVPLVERIRVGDPFDRQTQMGAIISQEQFNKVEAYIEHGKKEGKLLTGGERVKDFPKGLFLKPTVFSDLSFDSKCCQEEIFGPVLPVIPFQTAEQVVEMTNSTPYGLSASVWSTNINTTHYVSQKIRTGIVWVNCWFARDLRTPFGGQKSSGIGREGGRYGLDFFSELKTVCYRYK